MPATTSSAEEVRRRLNAAKGLLDDVQGTAEHAAVSRGQSDMVMAMLGSVKLDAADLGPIAELIAQCAWASPQEKAGLLTTVGQAVHTSSARRAKYQDFGFLGCYLLDRHWAVLLDCNIDYTLKLKILSDQTQALGLRTPSEETSARVTALLLLCIEGSAKARCLSSAYTRDVFLHVKKELKRRNPPPPLEVVAELSADVAEFRAKHPLTYDAVFGDQGPILCKFQFSEINAIASSIDQRIRPNSRAAQSVMPSEPWHAMVQMMQAMAGAMPSAMPSMQMGAMPSMQMGNGASLYFTQPRRPALRPALMAAASAAQGAPSSPQQVRRVSFSPSVQGTSPVQEHLPLSSEVSASGGGSQEVAIDTPETSTAEEGAPAKKVAKKTVEDAAAVILAAMNKKTEAKAEAKAKAALKRPAAASSTGPASSEGCPAADAKLPASSKGVPAADAKPPGYSVEWSRNQVLYRSGLKGSNQNKCFKFKSDEEREAAVSKAKKMVDAERKRRGLQ